MDTTMHGQCTCRIIIPQVGDGPQVVNNVEEALIGTDGLPK